MKHVAVVSAMVLGCLCASGVAVRAGDVGPNTTGLPTYPHLKSGGMMGSTTGKGCRFYDASSDDALPVVVAWYRAQLHGAKTLPMKNNGYGGRQADFRLPNRTQVVIFTSPRIKSAGTSINMSMGCSPVSS